MSRAKILATLLLLVAPACATAGPPATTAGRTSPPAVRTIPASVERVVDGDTAWFMLDGGKREKVRFIGVDTPESTTQHEPFGEEAADYTSSVLTAGRRVALQIDVDERDRYGRLLAYVWLSPPETGEAQEARAAMLNAMLVDRGFATVLTVPPNVAYADLFVRLQVEARTAGRGLWRLGS